MKQKKLSRLILLLGSMLFFLQGDNYASAPVLVDLAKEFGMSFSHAALTVTFYMVPFGFFTLIFGPLGDRFGKATILRSAAFFTGIFSLANAFMPSFFFVCMVRIFNGAFAAAVMPVSMALIGEMAGTNTKTLQASLSKTMSIMFLGGAVGPAIGGWLSHLGSWRLVYGFYGGAELILATVIFFTIPLQPVPQRKLKFFSAYGKALSRPNIIKTVPILFLVGLSILGLFPFLGKFLESNSSLSLSSIGLILSLFGIGALFGGRFTPIIKSRFEKLYFPITGIIGTGSLGIMVLNSNSVLFGAGLCGYGFAFMMLQPVLIARAQQAFPSGRGTVMSLASLHMAMGGGIGTLLNSALLRYWQYDIIFKTSAVLFFSGCILAWLTSPRESGMPLSFDVKDASQSS